MHPKRLMLVVAAMAALAAPAAPRATNLDPPPCLNPNPNCPNPFDVWTETCPQASICPGEPIVARIHCQSTRTGVYCEAEPFELEPLGRLSYKWEVEGTKGDRSFGSSPSIAFECAGNAAVVHVLIRNSSYQASTAQKVRCP